MSDLIASGRIVDIVLGFVVLEIALLTVYRRVSGRGIATLDLLFNLLAGVCLLLALRSALVGAAWIWIAVWLSAALLAHVADLARRWRR